MIANFFLNATPSSQINYGLEDDVCHFGDSFSSFPSEERKEAMASDVRRQAESVVSDGGLFSELKKQLKSSRVSTSVGATLVIQKYMIQRVHEDPCSSTEQYNREAHSDDEATNDSQNENTNEHFWSSLQKHQHPEEQQGLPLVIRLKQNEEDEEVRTYEPEDISVLDEESFDDDDEGVPEGDDLIVPFPQRRRGSSI
eukprot:CAMPEP_0116842520 /NCGR_PEP_ID=MMETSP0418-20121206/11566_1 /TAXON_ID=1158023 /ORGANISM="Astrosyne radiata, Strain 13vi08-1A" /LENGTH=197 /DNA_ID=CAMNT_0004473147 /DNA_START=122 /DNA_END=715 /DNA_ORIENTATION=-